MKRTKVMSPLFLLIAVSLFSGCTKPSLMPASNTIELRGQIALDSGGAVSGKVRGAINLGTVINILEVLPTGSLGSSIGTGTVSTNGTYTATISSSSSTTFTPRAIAISVPSYNVYVFAPVYINQTVQTVNVNLFTVALTNVALTNIQTLNISTIDAINQATLTISSSYRLVDPYTTWTTDPLYVTALNTFTIAAGAAGLDPLTYANTPGIFPGTSSRQSACDTLVANPDKDDWYKFNSRVQTYVFGHHSHALVFGVMEASRLDVDFNYRYAGYTGELTDTVHNVDKLLRGVAWSDYRGDDGLKHLVFSMSGGFVDGWGRTISENPEWSDYRSARFTYARGTTADGHACAMQGFVIPRSQTQHVVVPENYVARAGSMPKAYKVADFPTTATSAVPQLTPQWVAQTYYGEFNSAATSEAIETFGMKRLANGIAVNERATEQSPQISNQEFSPNTSVIDFADQSKIEGKTFSWQQGTLAPGSAGSKAGAELMVPVFYLSNVKGDANHSR